MKLNTLYKRATNGKVVEHTIEVVNNGFRTISGYTDGLKTTSEFTYCLGKNLGKKNETTPESQAMAEAQAMWTKRVELGSFEDINNIDNEVYFSPMLAHKWEDRKDKITYPLFSQPKLDGIRCVMKADGMWSRNGKRIVSAPHIFESMKHMFEAYPDLILDGELYADKFANDFNAICSLVKKTKPTAADLKASAESIQYWIYDVPSCDGVFSERRSELFNLSLSDYCKTVPTHEVSDEKTLMELYEIYVGEGYEGQMVRTNEKYENKRSKSLLKHKSFIDEEYTILNIIEGIGNKAGMVGSFVFENKDGRQFHSSPKFNWEECTAMWNNKADLIGKSATVKYFNLTPGDSPVPRFPYVIKINREEYE